MVLFYVGMCGEYECFPSFRMFDYVQRKESILCQLNKFHVSVLLNKNVHIFTHT